MLSVKEKSRYKRTIMLPAIGEKGQNKLKKTKILVIGAGGLGSPAILHLASIGIGTIGIIDHDVVDVSNLQRQIIYTTEDIGIPKVLSSKKKVTTLNPHIKVITYEKRFEPSNAKQILLDYDFILDCVDNFETKLHINETCVKNNKPFSHAGILEYNGQCMTILPAKTACYRCAFPSIPASLPMKPVKLGVLGTVPGIIGTIQANEAIKYILGIGNLLTDRLLTINALNMYLKEIHLNKKETCPVCKR